MTAPRDVSTTGVKRLRRMLDPTTVAIVGARDDIRMGENWRGTLDGSARVVLVNPHRSTVFGRPTVPSLSAIGHPVDAVFCLLNAEAAVAVAEEAVTCGAGGLVLIAAGFAEVGDRGRALQDRLADAAAQGGFPVVGPNGAGYIRVPRSLDLTMLARFGRRPGGASLIAHSGGLVQAFAAAADRAGGLGLNLLISAGNEAVTDMADYLEYLVSDDDTRVILLALETLRRPNEFFDAARRAHEAGKPIIAVKIGRHARSARMAASHTGVLTTDHRMYDIALRQANIQIALDVEDLVDRAQFLEQFPRQKWSQVAGLAVMAGSGGMAALGADLAAEEGILTPEMPRLDRWIGSIISGAKIANPFDSRGMARDEVFRAVYKEFASAPEIDSAVFLGQFADCDEQGATTRAEQVVTSRLPEEKTVIISPFGGLAGRWLDEYRKYGVGIGNGARGVMRGLAAMRGFMLSDPHSFVRAADTVPRVKFGERPTAMSEMGRILTFDATMALLESCGIAVAPYCIVSSDEVIRPPLFNGPYVVKLADVAHRVAVDAVRMPVDDHGLTTAIADLRHLATERRLTATVVIQPLIRGSDELFLGADATSPLGPAVLFGRGGSSVETLPMLGGRRAPFDAHIAETLLAEFDGAPFDHWSRTPRVDVMRNLRDALVSVGQLIAGARDWLSSLDVNPMIATSTGYVAVDGLAIVNRNGEPTSPQSRNQ